MCALLCRGVTVTYITAAEWLPAVDRPAAVAAYQQEKALKLLRWRSKHVRLRDVMALEPQVQAPYNNPLWRSTQPEQQHPQRPPDDEQPPPPASRADTGGLNRGLAAGESTLSSLDAVMAMHGPIARPYTSKDWADDPSALLLRHMWKVYCQNRNRATQNTQDSRHMSLLTYD
jgi:hypothetical protein